MVMERPPSEERFLWLPIYFTFPQCSKRADNHMRPQIFNKQHFCPLELWHLKKNKHALLIFCLKTLIVILMLDFVGSCFNQDSAQKAGFNLLDSHIRKLLLPHQISGSTECIIHLSEETEDESDFASTNGAVQMAQCLQRGRNIVF